MLDLPSLILLLRPDLVGGMRFDVAQNRFAYFNWLLTDGTREYSAIPQDAGLRGALAATLVEKKSTLTLLQKLVLCRRPDVAAAFALPAGLAEFLAWFYTHGVEECGIWPFLADAEQQ
jgi:hypothetical protein